MGEVDSGQLFEKSLICDTIRQKSNITYSFTFKRVLLFLRNSIKRGIGKDNANKNFSILDQYKMPVATGLIIDTGETILPLNRNAYYCPVGMIGL